MVQGNVLHERAGHNIPLEKRSCGWRVTVDQETVGSRVVHHCNSIIEETSSRPTVSQGNDTPVDCCSLLLMLSSMHGLTVGDSNLSSSLSSITRKLSFLSLLSFGSHTGSQGTSMPRPGGSLSSNRLLEYQ